jgi:hypothetical protein
VVGADLAMLRLKGQSCSPSLPVSRSSEVKREATVVLFFMMRYAPDSGFFFMLTSEHKRKIHRGWKNIPSKILLLEEGKKKEV